MKRLLLIAAVLGCGAPVAVVNGKLEGQDFQASDAVAYTFTSETSPTSGILTVWITERASICQSVRDSQPLNGTRFVVLSLGILAPDEELVPGNTPGKYEVTNGGVIGTKMAAVQAFATEACGVGKQLDAISGTVELTHVGSDATHALEVAGRFDVKFGGGVQDVMSGEFFARDCALMKLAQLNVCRYQ